jgi:hypothetical protein
MRVCVYVPRYHGTRVRVLCTCACLWRGVVVVSQAAAEAQASQEDLARCQQLLLLQQEEVRTIAIRLNCRCLLRWRDDCSAEKCELPVVAIYYIFHDH